MTSLRMPMSTASRKGLSAVAASAEDQRVVLTSHGRTVAVVDSPQRAEEQARLLREASLAVLDAAADLISARGKQFDLDEVCARLGVDPERVRARAALEADRAR
ncbi:MAG TPA: hypothetical protein VMV41_07460 [Cellulomonadaceae bacterium]|nr:hypothetical protein [Cellulomonadaceae bacterium]